jgi:hypothetical protein
VKRSCCAPLLRCCFLLLSAIQIVALLVAFERPALAYVDPGSGFVFLQVAGSMVAGAAYYLRHRLKRLLETFRPAGRLARPAEGPAEVVENQR